MIQGKALPILLALSIVSPFSAIAHAETSNDPAPFIAAKVVNENAGKKVLFDNSHGETSGAADWVIDGGFSDFGNALAGAGFYVKELRKNSSITLSDLQGYDVFVVAEAQYPFKPSEQQAILDYVSQGGSIFFIADHYNADRNKNRWDGSEVFNGYRRGAWNNPAAGMTSEEAASSIMEGVQSSDWLANNFGVRFRYNALGDINADGIVSPDQAFGITQGVSAVAMHAGSTLAIVDPNKAKGLVYLPSTSTAWASAVDQGVYNGGGHEEGAFSAIAKIGLGKAAFIGDSSPIEDATPKYLKEETGGSKTTYDGWKEVDDALYVTNLVNWLAKQESYTSLSEVPGLELDQPTPLLSMEEPSTSTEPQTEPWAAPSAGYKWWDSSTYKAGSYGSTAVVANPTYGSVHQATLPNAEPFQIRVEANNLTPNQTVSNFNIGIYLAGGTQVGQVKNDDGTWPSSYGYSSAFSMTADSNGYAHKDLTVQIKPGTSGSATLRVRQGSTALKSESVTIDNVPAESLPSVDQPQPQLPALSTIAEVRNQGANQSVTVEGIVTTEPGIFGGQAFYLQDGTGGIYVYQNTAGFHAGDRVSVSASTSLYNSELELASPLDIHKTETTQVPAPNVVTALNDSNQGQLVTLNDAEITNIVSATPPGSFEFDADTSGSIGGTITHVRVDARTGLTQTDFTYQAGDKVTITGISAIYNGVYQLKPRGLSDFAAVTVDPDPVTAPALSDITFEQHPSSLRVGDSKQTVAQAVYSDSSKTDVTAYATWESGDMNIATVSQGLVTAVSAGSTVIEATYQGITRSFPIYVSKKHSGSSAPATAPSVTSSSDESDKSDKSDNPADSSKPEDKPTSTRPDIFQTKVVKADTVVQHVEQLIKQARESAAPAAEPADTKGHWSEQTVDTFMKLHIIEGYKDGSFKPDSPITRAEFAVLISRAFHITEDNASAPALSDVEDHWAKDAIESLAAVGVVGGYGDGTFQPDKTISREEMVTILSRIVNLKSVQTDANTGSFTDVADSYAAQAIEEAANAGIIEGSEDGAFNPKQNSTRAEALTVILHALILNPEVKQLLDSLK
ncbi:S-layer homology domain-containing protein [Paenibacillus hexagrammi]|uniref:S-layer homology domain-containing protein n=1 Tax=Paenibacillus hexagrammi TaxID=2908839 RepID=A0ABY3STM4_9BACL|nr:S-layer homology domain-containing protein [Paenibacillus sp. YPD9-1]UJF36430.1 S-layer homology domain-containing protein [Paenibacillus sp. YPD9-1]